VVRAREEVSLTELMVNVRTVEVERYVDGYTLGCNHVSNVRDSLHNLVMIAAVLAARAGRCSVTLLVLS
jgi:hypothetical protein